MPARASKCGRGRSVWMASGRYYTLPGRARSDSATGFCIANGERQVTRYDWRHQWKIPPPISTTNIAHPTQGPTTDSWCMRGAQGKTRTTGYVFARAKMGPCKAYSRCFSIGVDFLTPVSDKRRSRTTSVIWGYVYCVIEIPSFERP